MTDVPNLTGALSSADEQSEDTPKDLRMRAAAAARRAAAAGQDGLMTREQPPINRSAVPNGVHDRGGPDEDGYYRHNEGH